MEMIFYSSSFFRIEALLCTGQMSKDRHDPNSCILARANVQMGIAGRSCSPSLGRSSVNLRIHRESSEHPGLGYLIGVIFLGKKSHPPPPEEGVNKT
jgi:hypothetical protein